MIIIEGPDGTGKSNLVRRIHEQLGIPVHARASGEGVGPDGGPVDNLWQWTCRDVASWEREPAQLYDRHPLISEYIYGPIARGAMKPGFTHPSARAMRRKMEQQCLVIFALPPLELVRNNVHNEDISQMPGVVDQIDGIYGAYLALASTWGGWSKVYDYHFAQRVGYDEIYRAVRLHVAQWRRTS